MACGLKVRGGKVLLYLGSTQNNKHVVNVTTMKLKELETLLVLRGCY